MGFSDFEKTLSGFFYKSLPIKGNISFNEYEDGYRAGIGMIGDGTDPIQVVFSIPKCSDDLYLIISDGDPEELSKEVSSLQSYNENTSHLCVEHTVPTQNKYVKESGWCAYLISRPEVTYKGFPDTKDISGRNIRFHLVMPIAEGDRKLKIEKGIDQLMEKYGDEGRELFTFKRNA